MFLLIFFICFVCVIELVSVCVNKESLLLLLLLLPFVLFTNSAGPTSCKCKGNTRNLLKDALELVLIISLNIF